MFPDKPNWMMLNRNLRLNYPSVTEEQRHDLT
jgi:hypothetical protein